MTLQLSSDGQVIDSNGRLEALLTSEIVNRPFAELLDESSQSKWGRILAERGTGAEARLWELVLQLPSTLELRTFAAVWGRDAGQDFLWLVEYSRDAKLQPMYEELAAANEELVQVQRDLARERARLSRVLEREAEARSAAERATNRLRFLHGAVAAMAHTDTQDTIARDLLLSLCEALGLDTAAILLMDDDGGLEVLAAVGLEAGYPQPPSSELRLAFAGRVTRERRSIVVNNPKDSDVANTFLRSTMGVVAGSPLMVGDRLIGILRVGSLKPGSVSEEDLQIIELAARDAASAIERSRLLKAERAAREEAETAVRQRDHVLAIVAHDLRNPLARVSTAASLLAEDSLAPDKRRQLVALLQRASSMMSRLIGDLLDVASIENGRLSVDRQLVNVASLAAEACQSFMHAALERGIALEPVTEGEIPPVSADRERVLQMLGNLLDNAMRLTPSGGRVQVRTAFVHSCVRLSVGDTGPGIPANDLPHLFDSFWHGGGGRRGSAGLGLAISKGIAEAHGGRLWVESTEGKGSEFHIELPPASSSPD